MATSNKSIGHEWNDLPLFAGDTPVSLSVKQVTAKVKKILATCGLGYERPLANYDPDTQSWRMSAGIFPLGEQPSLPILPPSGMTRNGALFQQPAWEPLTGGTASSLWPTPTTQETEHPNAQLTETGRRLSKDGTSSHSVGLADAVRMWPTPTAVTRPMEGNVRLYRAKVEAGEMTEQEAEAILGKSVWEAQGKISAMWPTPTASDAWTDGLKSSQQKEGSRHSVNLPSAAGGKLNPTWVEWLMGFPPEWTDLEA